MEQPDPKATQAMPVDPMKTVIGSAAPTAATTQALRPVQCPVCKQHNPPGERFCVECGLLFEGGLPEGETVLEPSVPLPCLLEAATGKEHPLRLGENSIGREGTDVLLGDPRVSRRHALLVLTQGGAELEDLGSTNGTKLDGQPLEAGTRVPVRHGAKLSLGGFEMTLSLPGEAMRTEAMSAPETPPTPEEPAPVLARLEAETGSTYDLREGEVTLGRRSSNVIVIQDPYVSGAHARFTVHRDSILFVDLGSTNGSTVNNQRVEPGTEVPLADGDCLTVGQTKFTLRILEGSE